MTLFIETFPVLVAFENLDMLESQQIAKKALHGLSGIYGFVHIPTGASYIGSSVNLADRIMDHIQNNSSNLHLQSAIVKYGLSHFAFVILEYCLSSDIIKREQHYLDILFSLPANLRYNFARFAEASFKWLTHSEETRARMSDSHTGITHSEETRTQMSESQQLVDRSGANNPMYCITPINAFQSGANHPMYGITPTNAMTVNVYSIDNVLVRSFTSQVAVAKWLGIHQSAVSRYIKSGKVWNNLYRFVKSMS